MTTSFARRRCVIFFVVQNRLINVCMFGIFRKMEISKYNGIHHLCY